MSIPKSPFSIIISIKKTILSLEEICNYSMKGDWNKASKILNTHKKIQVSEMDKVEIEIPTSAKMQNPKSEDLLYLFYDSLNRINILKNIIDNLSINNQRIFEEFGNPDGDFFSLTYDLNYQTRELSNTFYSFSNKYEIISEIFQLRKKIEYLRIKALNNRDQLFSEYVSPLCRLGILEIPNQIFFDSHHEAAFDLSKLDNLIEGLISKTVLEFPITAGAVPEGIHYHPYARGVHPSQSIVLKSYKETYFPFNQNSSIFQNALKVIGSSFMGLLNSLLISLIKENSNSTLAIALKSNKTYFEIEKILSNESTTLFGYNINNNEARVKWIKEKEITDSLAQANVFYIDSVHNGPGNEIEYLDEILNLVKSYQNIKTIIIDITLDPFLELLKKRIKVGDHQIIILLNSLTKFAQSGLNCSIGGIALILNNKNALSKNRALQLQESMTDVLPALGAHMDPKLAVCIQTNRTSASEYLNRIRRNSTTLSNWLREVFSNHVMIYHQRNDKISSPLIFLKIKNNSLDPLSQITDYQKNSDVYKARQKSLESSKEDESKNYANYITLYLHWWFTIENEGSSFVRFGTSFGFNRTTIMTITTEQHPDAILLRIAPGIEEFERLWWIRCGINSLNSKWYEKKIVI